MKERFLAVVLVAFIAIGAAVAMQPSERGALQDESSATFLNVVSIRDAVDAMPKEDLNQSESEGILYMREEEKMARDAYWTFGDRYGLPVFENIAEAEETHMDSVKVLMDKYDLTDPILEAGEFANSDLQAMYDDLVERGNSSAEEALRVGAVIEETDIQDLKDRLAETDNEDITMVYESLMRGSRNHLRAFVNNLERRGIDYTPAVLSQEEYDQIVGTPIERGLYQS
ncbi:MAG TPA: DUF2202 domain-containing protein [Methanothrix sp.]|nr:DUF2202 domain-containing protein [Methanothrix sp.]HPJ83286.1 DUF2202 domain-containing protein [Methanothrix sp.]HPR66151.1 DUF2202 domain-containing protein [Methanothrix sp.]